MNISDKDSELAGQMVGFKVSFAIYIPIAMLTIFILWFRVGISPSEKDKRFFNSKHVRILLSIPLEENALIK